MQNLAWPRLRTASCKAASIGFRDCRLAPFRYPSQASKAQNASVQLLHSYHAARILPRHIPCMAQAPPCVLQSCFYGGSQLPFDPGLGSAMRPAKLFLWGIETAVWHLFVTLQKPQKAQNASVQLLSELTMPQGCCQDRPCVAEAPQRVLQSCFSSVSKLPFGTFSLAFKSPKKHKMPRCSF